MSAEDWAKWDWVCFGVMYFKCPPDGGISLFKDTAQVGSGGLVDLQYNTVCDDCMKLNNYMHQINVQKNLNTFSLLQTKSWFHKQSNTDRSTTVWGLAAAWLGLVWPVAFDAWYELTNIIGSFHWLTHWLFYYCATTLQYLLPSLICHVWPQWQVFC